MLKNILCATAIAAVVAPAIGAEWMNDFEAAKAKAAQENKAILVDFTGSDWCGYCIRLRKEVLDTPAFEEYAAGKFVLMEVDQPRSKQLDPAVREQNNKLCQQYKIDGFPTILVLTPDGKVMGGFGGYRPTLDAVKAPLDAALDTAQLYQKANQATGDDKARLLMQAYDTVPEDMRDSTGILQEAIAADTNNVTSARDVVKTTEQRETIEREFSACNHDPHKMKAVIDKYLPVAMPDNVAMLERARDMVDGLMLMMEVDKVFNTDGPAKALAMLDTKLGSVSPEMRPRVLQAKFELQVLMSETEEDLAKAKATADELRTALPPHMVQPFDDFIAKHFSNPEKVLQDVKRQREALEAQKAQNGQGTK